MGTGAGVWWVAGAVTLLSGVAAAPAAAQAGQVEPAATHTDDRLHSFPLGGSGFSVVPRILYRLGPLHVDGRLDLALGEVDRFGGRARLIRSLGSGWYGAIAYGLSSSGTGGAQLQQHSLSLAIDGRRAGVAAGFRTGDVTFGVRGGELRMDVRTLEARLWSRARVEIGLTARVSDAIERLDARRVFEVGGYQFDSYLSRPTARTVGFTDYEIDVAAAVGPLRLMGVAGYGFADDARRDRRWLYARIRAPLRERLQLIAEAGGYPGYPATDRLPREFVRLGFEVRLPVPASPVVPTLQPPASGAGASARVETGSDGPRLLVDAPEADAVEIRGNFTGWKTVTMNRRPDGPWVLQVPTGMLQFNVRLDGGDWIVPEGAVAAPDEFTGTPVAVMVVGSDA